MSSHVASPGENILAEFPEAVQVADHRVTNFGCGRGKIWLIERAAKKGSGGYQDFLSLRARLQPQKHN
jgi:hypothetical protein